MRVMHGRWSRFAVAIVMTLTTAGVSARNLGFMLKRDLDVRRRSAAPNRPLQNVYWISFPVINGMADVANTAAPERNKCVGDADGPATTDGLINSDDVICDLWVSRSNAAQPGMFLLATTGGPNCLVISRIATFALGRIIFTGTAFPVQRDAGYEVLLQVPQGATYSPRNPVTFVGSHDPAWTGRMLAPAPTCPPGQTTDCCPAFAPRIDLVSVPYHVMYQTSAEVLCGLEGVDWTDGNGDGKPDRCWDDADADGVYDAGERVTGIFDGRVAVTVSYFDNTEAINAPVSQTATIQQGSLRFSGTRFKLVPGDALLVTMSKTHTPTVFLPPHF